MCRRKHRLDKGWDAMKKAQVFIEDELVLNSVCLIGSIHRDKFYIPCPSLGRK